MANRFQNIGFQPRNIEFFPEVQQDILPDISGLGNYMQSLDQQLDQELELPNYLQQSESDRNAYLNYKKEAQGFKQRAVEAFKSGKNDLGAEELRQYKNFLRNSKQPDGTYTRLEQGKAQYNAQVKRLQDMYMKGDNANPILYNHSINLLNKGISPFEDEFGNARAQIDLPTMYSDKPRREFNKEMNEVLDNIEPDQIAYSGDINKVRGLTLQQLISQGKTKYLDPTKVADVILGAITPEMKESFKQFGEAQGLGGQGAVLNRKLLQSKEFQAAYKKDPNVILQAFDTSSALGAAAQALVKSKIFKQEDKSSSIFTDQEALEGLKQRNRKGLKEYEMTFGETTGRTSVFTKGSGMMDLDIKDGKIAFGHHIPKNYLSDPETSKYLSTLSPEARKAAIDKAMVKDYKNMGLDEYVETEEGQNNKALVEIVSSFPRPLMDKGNGVFEKMSDKQYNKAVINLYEKKKHALSKEDVDYVEYRGSKRGDIQRKTLFGKGKEDIGTIVHKNIIVTSPTGEPKTMLFNAFLNEYGMDSAEFKEKVGLLGEIKAGRNSITPSGINGVVKTKDGFQEIIISDININDAREKTPLWILGQAAQTAKLTPWTNTGIPEIDQYGKIRASGRDMWTIDALEQKLLNEYDPKTIEQLEAEIDKLEKNPALNNYLGRQVDLYAYDPNSKNPNEEGQGQPIKLSDGSVLTFEQLELLMQSKNNGRRK